METPLAEWMRQQGRSDAEVAADVGQISRSQVSRIRRGTSRPSWRVAKALEQTTGIPADALMGAADRSAA